MAKSKKKSGNSWWSSLAFWQTTGKKKPKRKKRRTKAEIAESRRRVRIFLASLAVLLATAGVAVGFRYMDDYVHSEIAPVQQNRELELKAPEWISPELQSLIARTVGSTPIKLDENAARRIAAKLEGLDWLYNVHVQIGHRLPKVSAGFRKPSAIVTVGRDPMYVSLVQPEDPLYSEIDDRIITLSYMPVEQIYMPKIEGFSTRPPAAPGMVWPSSEVLTTVQLIETLRRMDRISTPDKPLLNEIERIDLSNYNGRRNSARPHIMMYTKDGTEIWWGAAYGDAARFQEAIEQEKIAALYSHYKAHGNRLQGTAKYVDIRWAKKILPRAVPH